MMESMWNPYGFHVVPHGNSIWNDGIHMESMTFHMIPGGMESLKWLGSQPKHIPYGMDGMTWIPYGFHMDSMWNVGAQ